MLEEPPVNDLTIYEFDGFRLVPGEDLLLRNGERISLNIKSFGVLKMLVERHGHLVTKSELIDTVWKDAFVEEGSLTKSIWLIRQALGDTSKERFIQTVPRRGYRFIYPVSVIAEGSGAFRISDLRVRDNGQAEETSKPETHTNGELGSKSAEILPTNGQVVRPDKTTTVNLRPGDIASARSSLLARLRGSAPYAGIGVVLLIALALYVALSGRSIGHSEHALDRGTKNDEAYRLYLLANNLMEQRGAQNVQRGLEAVDKAVALDPNFARAWAAKSMFHLLDSTLTPSKRYQLSKESLDKALSLDPDLSEAYSVLCYHKIGYEFDFAGGETVCKHAVDLDPNSAKAHSTYAQFLSTRGRFDESIAEARKAIDLEPQSYLNQMDYGLILYYARRFEEEAQWKDQIQRNPNDSFNYRRLSRCMERQGKESEAFDYLIKSLTLEGVDNETLERFRATYAATGFRGVAAEEIKLSESRPYNSHKNFNIACLYARLGDKDKAFQYLEKTYQDRDDLINEIRVEPRLDPLRDDPRYADLVRRVETQH